MIIFFITILFLINNNELYNDEPFVDFWKVEKRINDLKNDAVVDVRIGKYILLYISQEVFQSVRVVPLIASMSLMIITYLFTVQITQKRFAGLISMSLVLQSNLFLTYSSSSTYSNFWILFYLTSLYFVNKKWILSPITFSFSIFTKYLTPFYLPVSLYHIVKSELSKNKKILMLSGHLLVPIIGVGLHFTGIFAFPITELQPDLFITGFKDFSKFFVNDLLILVFLLPLTVALFVLSKKGLKEADTIMLMIFIVLLSAPILPGFFYALNNHAYRFVPLVIFFSIGIGLLFSNKVNLLEKSKSKNRKISYVIFIPTLTVVLISMLSVIFSNIIEGQYRLST